MNALEQICGWLMIAFGGAQSVANFRVQSSSYLTRCAGRAWTRDTRPESRLGAAT